MSSRSRAAIIGLACTANAAVSSAQAPAGPESAQARPASASRRPAPGLSDPANPATGATPSTGTGTPRPKEFNSRPPQLRPIEAGTTDASPLAASSRAIPLDLRAPLDFERVFALSARDQSLLRGEPAAANQARFARQSGGLTAVFPRSTYLETRFGTIPTVPPDTVFWIGSPFRQPWDSSGWRSSSGNQPTQSQLASEPLPRSAAALPADRSARHAASPATPAANEGSAGVADDNRSASATIGPSRTGQSRAGHSSTSASPAPSIWTDESARRNLLDDLMTRALATPRPSGGPR